MNLNLIAVFLYNYTGTNLQLQEIGLSSSDSNFSFMYFDGESNETTFPGKYKSYSFDQRNAVLIIIIMTKWNHYVNTKFVIGSILIMQSCL